MSLRPLILLAVGLLAGGCGMQRAAMSPLGASVSLQPPAGRYLYGELLAVTAESVWIKPSRGDDRVRGVALADLKAVRVNRYGRGLPAFTRGIFFGAGTGLAMALACSSVADGCGAVFLFSVASSALLGLFSDAAADGASGLLVTMPEYERLRPFARFPQGFPQGFPPGYR